MKIQVLVLGVWLCLGAVAPAQTGDPQAQNQKSTQSANRLKRNTSAGEQARVGCVDQQNGQYILHDIKTEQLLTLKADGDPEENFARFVGHQVEATGTESAGTLKITHIGQVSDMCRTGK